MIARESIGYESVGMTQTAKANGPRHTENVRFVSEGAGLSPGAGPFFFGRRRMNARGVIDWRLLIGN